MNDDDGALAFARYPTRVFDTTETAVSVKGIESASLTNLVAHLTSNEVLNYDLVADFFLTYRLFTDADTVQELLFSRLVWAIQRADEHEDEVGRDVSVRTFVVIRHWLLNFFADDFVPSYDLRKQFVDNLNKLHAWVKQDQFVRIVSQLRKCWIRNIAIYWAVEEDEDRELEKPLLSPGGNFGSLEVNNNKNIIACYNEPIAPTAKFDSNEVSEDIGSSGFLIRGGINVSNDVEVKTIAPPTPVVKPSLKEKSSTQTLKAKSSMKTLKSLKSKPSLRNLFHSQQRKNKVNTIPNDLITPEQAFAKEISLVPNDSQEQVRIDILSARVIEELDRVLKCHSLINKTSKDWDESRESALGRSSSDVTATNSFITSSEFTEDEDDEDDDFNRSIGEPCLTSEGDSMSRISYKPPRKRNNNNNNPPVSMVDNLEIRERLSTRGSAVDVSSICSFESYDSEKSVCMQKETTLYSRDYELNNNRGGLLRRQNQFHNLRKVANIVQPSESSGSSVLTGSSRFSMGTTQHNPGAPFSGVDEKFAAELAAIPDDSPDEDAVGAALEKLEGTYKKKKKNKNNDMLPPSSTSTSVPGLSRNLAVIGASSTKIHMDSDLDSNLYDDAFATTAHTPYDSDLEQLNIPKGYNRNGSYSSSSTAHNSITNNDDHDDNNDNNTNENNDQSNDNHNIQSLTNIPQLVRRFTNGSGGNNNHTPFILNYTSKELSEQLTLIERDALAQVDWKELIELRWPGSNLDPIQNWVTFLSDRRNNRIGGVELVISRFNLVVNWVKSEVLLTWSIQQRVETVSRFIHIAYQCRQNLRNYATMMQIVLALGAPVIQRLKNTWSQIAPIDLKMFQQMEELVLPMGNFANLRRELNGAMGEFSGGCIPFVGMYLSDLTFNAEQPTRIDHDKINFRKCVTAASIVKSLIQCIQWSEKYTFHYHQHVLSKCLYLHSLTVEEMEACFVYLTDN
ncbi:hypothetical protein TRICI_001545 [Trichomonascus ciferrii]|uniref:Ras-GEF domain-containing protein n=1 Tax=Trichomonascus ciferrii TaxID=44093 RepID=A0A642V911_9ASCO|nr:hypothetical protein TRICI_001545 [Trichomonascus ciferrii]